MRILLLGKGGREHALAWKIVQSPRVEALIVLPGSEAIALLPRTRCRAGSPVDLEGVLEVARRERVDLVVSGPEAPLVAGIADRLAEAGILCLGPTRAGALLEGSKVYAKELMRRLGVPTADFEVVSDLEAGRRAVARRGLPLVIKAEGLAGGKGAIVCTRAAEADAALEAMFVERRFGGAGDRAVIESFLPGEEASFMALVSDRQVVPLASSQDYKQVDEGDRGPNTGGMGAVSPAPIVTAAIEEAVLRRVIRPVAEALADEGRPFRGILYAGLMIEGDQVWVLEFNVRLGDPETQPLMLRLESDLADLLEGAARGELDRVPPPRWRRDAAACVVATAPGYPGSYPQGLPIEGLEGVRQGEDLVVFHAGTRRRPEGGWETAGGRVLGVTARGVDLAAALRRCYGALDSIRFPGMHLRRDIGYRLLGAP